jgi:hypothetical protein
MEGRGPPLLEPTAVVFLELLRCHRANAAVGARDAHCRHAEDRASPPSQVVAEASGRGRHLTRGELLRLPSSANLTRTPPSPALTPAAAGCSTSAWCHDGDPLLPLG